MSPQSPCPVLFGTKFCTFLFHSAPIAGFQDDWKIHTASDASSRPTTRPHENRLRSGSETQNTAIFQSTVAEMMGVGIGLFAAAECLPSGISCTIAGREPPPGPAVAAAAAAAAAAPPPPPPPPGTRGPRPSRRAESARQIQVCFIHNYVQTISTLDLGFAQGPHGMGTKQRHVRPMIRQGGLGLLRSAGRYSTRSSPRFQGSDPSKCQQESTVTSPARH
ncbi:hypothetical protein B0T22DRAFT_86773 [Podospora appendiculata]|uniref:Uncharacterized protein n=1 Tax=Podospora appendiculata TaxID=314037 RepID=A0AAE0XKN8_9PEZI|nr:hypothetical protein B0T22DRAFT_86773 [Podospora appendiculata]